MKTYKWTEKKDYSFEFISENKDRYTLSFNEKEFHNEDFCSECRDIYEIDIKRDKSGERLREDIKIRTTLLAIIEKVLSERCHSLVYVCDNSDSRADCRETLFEKYFDEMESINDIDKYVKSLCDETLGDCFNLNFIADKECSNFTENVEDFFCEHRE